MAMTTQDARRLLESRGYKISSRPAPARPASLYEKAAALDWEKLADRNQPLPQGLTVEQLLKAFEGFYIAQNQKQFLR